MKYLKNSLGQSHDIIRAIVKEGDYAIDATAGNGNDTLLLAELVGQAGRVYSFDVQEKAIEKTRERLKDQKLEDRVILLTAGHQNMKTYIDRKIKAVMFNLGYLPGGDHNLGTRWQSTCEALEAALELLEDNGVVTLVIYSGGDSGFEEKEKVIEFIKSIDYKRFTVMKTEFTNQKNFPPILVCIEKH